MTNVKKMTELDAKLAEIEQNLSRLRRQINTIGVTFTDPPTYEVVWEGRITFDVSAESNASAIEWVIGELKDFCEGSAAFAMTKSYTATKVEYEETDNV
jgi:3-methyladenine DNA glycosylase/8-oxoguanine DNA glycosylase